MLFVEILYLIVAAWLALYGFNALYLTWLRKWRYKRTPVILAEEGFDWPYVTVQLPVYNERYVVERLIDSVCRLDYPTNRLQIQVLDDSDDVTSDIIARRVVRHRAQGFEIEHIRRKKRVGYKGGALAHGLKSARGEFIAIFDADFLPKPHTLKSTLPYFYEDSSTGCIQTRWGHINPHSSWLTRAQAAGIDGHFLVQQETRSGERLFLNFNGTAGVWRRTCIEDAGGWQGDTLTEDLDLSFRAQLCGWRIQYLPHVNVPGELPVHISAFKRQQFRWAKGSIQTARKLLGDLWRSKQPLRIKITSTIHLTNYLVHPLILFNLLLTLPIMHISSPLLHIVPVFTLAAIGPLFMYWFSMETQGKSTTMRITHLVMLLVVGTGLSLNNTRAVIEAALGVKTSFLRTPKFNLLGQDKGTGQRDYTLPIEAITWMEGFMAFFAFGLLLYTINLGVWHLVFWLLLYTCGFAYIAGLGIIQSVKSRPKQPETELARLPDEIQSTSIRPSGD